MGPPNFLAVPFPLYHFSLAERFTRAKPARTVRGPCIATPHSVPLGQRTRGCNGRQEGCECGYYHLHRYLNNSIRLHNSSLPISSLNRLNQVLHRHRCCHLRCCHHPWFHRFRHHSCHSCHSCSTHYRRYHRHHSWFHHSP